MSRSCRISRGLCFLLLAATVFGGVSSLWGSPPAGSNAEVRREVSRLIAELDAETRTVRAAARNSLLAMGPSILPLLPADQEIATASIREAISEIRVQLQRESALGTLTASRVTLHGRYPLNEIVRRIFEQTGNRVETTGIDAARLHQEFTVDFASRPFWSAIDEFNRQAVLTCATEHRPRILVLEPAKKRAKDLAVADSGPFRVQIRSAAIRTAFIGSPKLLRIRWSLTAEPRLRPLFAAIEAKRLRLVGVGTTDFKPLTPTAKWELSMDEGAHSLQLNSDFEVPAGSLPSTVDFGGSFNVEVAAGPQRFVFDDLASAHHAARKFGSVAVAVRGVDFPPSNDRAGTARVEISLVYDQGGPAFESYRTWMYHNEAYLETRSGQRLTPQPIVSTRRQGDGSIAVEYNFADVHGALNDFRFVYVAPTLITQVPVEFRLPKIPVQQTASEGINR
jgi:hypothetical protein